MELFFFSRGHSLCRKYIVIFLLITLGCTDDRKPLRWFFHRKVCFLDAEHRITTFFLNYAEFYFTNKLQSLIDYIIYLSAQLFVEFCNFCRQFFVKYVIDIERIFGHDRNIYLLNSGRRQIYVDNYNNRIKRISKFRRRNLKQYRNIITNIFSPKFYLSTIISETRLMRSLIMSTLRLQSVFKVSNLLRLSFAVCNETFPKTV